MKKESKPVSEYADHSQEDFNRLLESTNKLVGEVESTEARIQELSKRLETLLEQNRVIAQGLVLLEKYVRGKTSLQGSPQPGSMQEYT